VPLAELSTEPSVVVHAKSGRRIGYGEIIAFVDFAGYEQQFWCRDQKPTSAYSRKSDGWHHFDQGLLSKSSKFRKSVRTRAHNTGLWATNRRTAPDFRFGSWSCENASTAAQARHDLSRVFNAVISLDFARSLIWTRSWALAVV